MIGAKVPINLLLWRPTAILKTALRTRRRVLNLYTFYLLSHFIFFTCLIAYFLDHPVGQGHREGGGGKEDMSPPPEIPMPKIFYGFLVNTLTRPLVCGTVFHLMSPLLHLSPPLGLLLNPTSSLFLIPISDFICSFVPVILDTVIVITFYIQYNCVINVKMFCGIFCRKKELDINRKQCRQRRTNKLAIFCFQLSVIMTQPTRWIQTTP